MVNPRAEAPVSSSVADLVQNYSIEASAGQVVQIRHLYRLLPVRTRVYILSPGDANIWDMARACQHVAGARLHPVPVVRPRAIPNRSVLVSMLGRYQDAGAEALMIADDDCGQPAGPFRESRDILETGILERRDFRQIGCTAYPTGNSGISDIALFERIAAQAAYARETGAYLWLTTAHTFTAKPVVEWLNRLAGRGINLPVRVGIPGPVDSRLPTAITTPPGTMPAIPLLSRTAAFARSPICQWSSDKLLLELADHRTRSAHSRLIGIHVSPLGRFARAARWMQSFDERIECWVG